jgi:hypothetical protein
MNSLYHHAQDSQLEASPANLETVRDLFRDNQRTGLLEVQSGPSQEATLFFLRGMCFAALSLLSERSLPIAVEQIQKGWEWETAHVRSMELPAYALRAAWQAVEWHPTSIQTDLEARHLETQLHDLKINNASGLLRIETPATDGFQLFWEGAAVNPETVTGSQRGFEDSLPVPHDAGEAAETWTCSFFPARLQTSSYRLLILRLAIADWMNAALIQYRTLAGQNLLLTLNYDLNAFARKNQWDVHLVGPTLINHHLFTQIHAASDVYRTLMRTASSHIAKVIGDGLTRRTFRQTFQALTPARQQTLAENDVSPEDFLT